MGEDMKPYKLWETVTGTSWETAKDSGLTDGSYEKNIDLKNRLLAGEFGELPSATENVKKKDEVELDQEDIEMIKSQVGSNQVVEIADKKYITNSKGELANLSDSALAQAGLTGSKSYIEQQNKLVASPYTSKDIVKAEPEWKKWDEVKSDMKEKNKMNQADLIANFKHEQGGEDNYLVVDKKKGLIHIYNPSSTEPLYSSAIDLGAIRSDAQTVTQVSMKNTEALLSIQAKLGLEEDAIYGDKTKNAIEEYNATHTDKIKFKPKYEVDWSSGNKSTGAGKFVISGRNPQGYKGLPSFNMMNENQLNKYLEKGIVDQVSTSIHAGYSESNPERVSNGCIRCSKATVQELYSSIQPLAEVYILPEDEGNAFVIENGKLNFKVQSPQDYEKYNLQTEIPEKAYTADVNEIPSKFSEDVLDYFPSSEQKQGQGINVTPKSNTRNYIPIKVEDNFTQQDFKNYAQENTDWKGFGIARPYDKFKLNRFVLQKAVTYNKKSLMSDLGINGDVYNELAKLTLGIPNAETKYGTHQRYGIKNNHQTLVNIGKYLEGNTSYNSVGMSQIKYDAHIKNPEIKELFKKYGITKEKLNANYDMDGYYSGLATMILLGNMYKNELGNIPEEVGIDWQDALLYMYQGNRDELKNKTATPYKNIYIQEVKEGYKGFDLYQLD